MSLSKTEVWERVVIATSAFILGFGAFPGLLKLFDLKPVKRDEYVNISNWNEVNRICHEKSFVSQEESDENCKKRCPAPKGGDNDTDTLSSTPQRPQVDEQRASDAPLCAKLRTDPDYLRIFQSGGVEGSHRGGDATFQEWHDALSRLVADLDIGSANTRQQRAQFAETLAGLADECWNNRNVNEPAGYDARLVTRVLTQLRRLKAALC